MYICVYIYIYIYRERERKKWREYVCICRCIYVYISSSHLVPSARKLLTLSLHLSLSFIAFGRPSGLHPVSSQCCCMLVRTGCSAFVRPCEGVHRRTSLMTLSLLLQQCSASLIRLIWIVFVIGGRWPYSCCFERCRLQDLFNIACSILV